MVARRTLGTLVRLLAFGWAIASAVVASAQAPVTVPPGSDDITAARAPEPPRIDGQLTEEAWRLATPVSNFTQSDPDEGRPATERTEVRILYDDNAVYVGLRLFDRQVALVSRRLSTRDSDADADRVTVFFDSMHDHLTGAIFRVSAANVQQDFILFNDTFWDSSWDGVWESQVSVDEEGWSVEMRIPLSQLRFVQQEHATWGINVERFMRRNNESAWLRIVPKSESGLASRMPHLVGIDGLQPRRRLELLPYVAVRNEFIAPGRTGHPFNDGSRAFLAAGLDLKVGVGSNLTLDGTVNPDFGQVEVDPAVVNLSAFETFFPEKRPFFLEGSQIFNNFGQGGANSFWGFNMEDPQLFYSRRIGRTPQIDVDGADFSDVPTATTILGAAKLTGKTTRGWSVGLLDAVTQHETARTRIGTLDGRAPVEPLANYFVGRVQRDLGRRAGAGMIVTAVSRRLDDRVFESALAHQAYVIGGDAHYFFDADRDWVVTGKVASSYVDGSTTFLDAIQRAPQRYYQRPDAPHVELDPSRTSLNGYAGRLNLNRNSGLVQVNASLWGVSPGFESNDLGFQGRADRAGAHGVLIWRSVTPDALTRSRFFWVAKSWTWNYNREMQSDGLFVTGNITFLNYWEAHAGWRLLRETLDDQLTRGGPSALNPRNTGWDVRLGTDPRKLASLAVSASSDWGDGGRSRTIGLSISLKPSSTLTIQTGPEISRGDAAAQYVTTVVDPTSGATYGSRYVFGRLERTDVSMTTRVGVVLTPKLSLQLFLQPLIAVGDYTEFKELAQPRTFDFTTYQNLALNDPFGIYTVDPDGNGAAPGFSFGNPDYNFKSARINAVFRWELRPGSTVYTVWTRQQQDLANPGHFALNRDAGAMARAPGDDVFMVKLTYWIGR